MTGTDELEREDVAQATEHPQDTGSVYEPDAAGKQPAAPAGESYAESYARAQLLEAQAEAVRAKTEAEIKIAQGKAEAQRKREELAAKRAAAKAEAEIAKIQAQAEREREEMEAARAERARQAAERERQEQERQRAEAERLAKAKSWRRAALGFAVVCAIVSLPVQMHAFWTPSAPWLLAAPVVLEGGAWVVLRGADAAVAESRPHWHYRLIAWLIAALAASINLAHGLTHFDAATAYGTAFASLAGPGVWDLHEHGRIRVRDGRLTRRERKARQAAQKAERAAQAERERQEKQAAEEAQKLARERADKLAKERQEKYAQEWERALMVAAALGETEVTEEVWRRAWWDLHHAEPGETVDVIRTRNMAALRMNRARSEGPDSKDAKGPQRSASSQLAPQMPASPKRSRTGPAVRGVRRKGDTPRYHPAARAAARQTALENAARSA
jgi:hypothetical protein